MTTISTPPGPEPAALVRNFLALMQARDLPAAQALLAPGFCMVFPGGAAMQRLDELLQWARQRYRFAGKHFERFDTCAQDQGAVVYCLGTLHGEWLDGTAFAGVRFIDRFEVVQGKITRQDVWNDMAESRPIQATAR